MSNIDDRTEEALQLAGKAEVAAIEVIADSGCDLGVAIAALIHAAAYLRAHGETLTTLGVTKLTDISIGGTRDRA